VKFKIGDLVIYRPSNKLEIVNDIRSLHIITIDMYGILVANDKATSIALFRKATDRDIKSYLSKRIKDVLRHKGILT